jgi:hypothetical protein
VPIPSQAFTAVSPRQFRRKLEKENVMKIKLTPVPVALTLAGAAGVASAATSVPARLIRGLA